MPFSLGVQQFIDCEYKSANIVHSITPSVQAPGCQDSNSADEEQSRYGGKHTGYHIAPLVHLFSPPSKE